MIKYRPAGNGKGQKDLPLNEKQAYQGEQKTASRTRLLFLPKAPPRIELGNKSFADFCLTAWLWRHMEFLEIMGTRLSYPYIGADYGDRTRHLNLGKVALYQMS